MRTRIYRTAALALSALLLASLFTACKKEEEPASTGPQIGYADATMIVDSREALEEAVREAEEKSRQPGVGIHYAPTAYSDNGIDFKCSLGNSATSVYDEYITVYGDSAYTDELYVSQLLRPGFALDSITLNHPLDPGSHTVYVSFTQVETAEDNTQTIKGTAYISMEFIVEQ